MAEKKPSVGQRDSKGRLKPGHTVGRRWKKGESGNPKGAPKKELSLTAIARALLEKDPERATRMVEKWMAQVEVGMTDARRDLQDRIEGRVPSPPTEITGDIIIKVVWGDKDA